MLNLGEVSGEDGKLREVLRKLLHGFLVRFPNQPYSSSMHIELEVLGACGSPFRRQVIEQMEDCWKKKKKRPMQRELKFRFEGRVKARVTCFFYEQ
jgi:hypothetical protein